MRRPWRSDVFDEEAAQWMLTVLDFGRTFRTAAGRVENLKAEAVRRGRH